MNEMERKTHSEENKMERMKNEKMYIFDVDFRLNIDV